MKYMNRKEQSEIITATYLFSSFYYSILSKISINVETFSPRENKRNQNNNVNLLQYEVVLFVR